MKQTFFITLNWNTSALCEQMIRSIERTTPEPHRWVILDNGSSVRDREELLATVGRVFPGAWAAISKGEAWSRDLACLVIQSPSNLGCVLGHNLCFDYAESWSIGDPFDIVMVDTDVEVFEEGWLTKLNAWAESQADPVGVVGLERPRDASCAGAVFLDPSGNWYIHQRQMQRPEPCQAESAGLGFAVLRHPATELRFDPAYRLYYKQDDDLCFQARADLGLGVWVYPVDNVHFGSGSLRANDYQVNEHKGWDAFHKVKSANQALFAKKWAWALKDRRPTVDAELSHLTEMRAVMAGRREGVSR